MVKKVPASTALGDELDQSLATSGLTGFFQKAEDRTDMTVEVVSTLLPRFDKFLHEKKHGLPKGRHVEIYSKDPEVGKTSIALQIGSAWQKQTQKVCIIDVEDTITNDYLVTLGYNMSPEAGSGMVAPYLAKGYDQSSGDILPAEEILGNLLVACSLFDLIIVDSIGALVKRADLEKAIGDTTVGGVSKNMWEMFRKSTHTKATILWINQALPQIGVYSPHGIKYKTGGGNAMPFATSLRLELRLVEKLTATADKDADVYGVVIDVLASKNKVSPPYKHVKLTYLNGEGFSPVWDLFQAAIEAKVIDKSGAWFSFKEERIGQGLLKSYQAFKENENWQTQVKEALANVQSV